MIERMEKSVDGSGFIFLSGKSKNQGLGLLGTVGGGFWLWGKLNWSILAD